MIPVPPAVLEKLAQAYDSQAGVLSHFSGGSEGSDGILYAYPYQDRMRLLKVMALPIEQKSNGLFRLEERLRFARFVGERGVRMVFPQLSPQDGLYETYQDGGHVWIAYTMEMVSGRTPAPEDQTSEFYQNWGQVIGKLHRISQEYTTWQATLNPITGHELLTWQEEWQDFYDWSKDLEVREMWVGLRAELEKLPLQRDSFGFVHNDAHIWNLLVEGNQITLLDFDVANHHWFVNDIAIACQSVLFDQSGGMHKPVHDRQKLVSFLRDFLAGYQREYDLEKEWLDKLDLFYAYRRILLFTVMHGWISSQPEMHAGWRKMIMEQPEVLGEVSRVLKV
ncbi:MAG: hypothetical protein EHM41_06530 [Chloroflexi bacterium]|nr:MAG: hypothetical protein EHM41_06530 [Chloroflexota bacterium]